MTRFFVYACFIAGAVFLLDCTSRRQAESSVSTDSTVTTSQNTSEEISRIIHNLPPPTEIPFLLKSMGANYLPNTTNSLDNISRYEVSNHKLALNLGVYSTDVGYLSSYDLVDDAKLYLDACKRISESVGVSTAYGNDLIVRFQENLDSPDSLAAIINEGLLRAEDQLEELGEIRTAALALTGSFIEGLYIVTSIVDFHLSDNELNAAQQREIVLPLINLLTEQQYALLDNISILKSLERDTETIRVLDLLANLRYSYETLQSYVNNSGASYEVDVNAPAVREILQEIRSVRAYIITP